MSLILGTNSGFVTTRPTSDPLATNEGFDSWAHANKDTSPSTAGKVTEIGVWVDTASGAADLVFGLYSHDSGSNKPDTLLGSVTVAKGTTSGWKYGTVNITISGSTVYWMAVQLDDVAVTTNLNVATSGGSARDVKFLQTTLTDPWGTSDAHDVNYMTSIYAVWEAASTATSVNIGDTWKTIDFANSSINIGDTWKTIAGASINIGDIWKTVYGSP